MSQNITGQGLDYETFKQEFDSDPAYAELIDDFNERGVVLKTKASAAQDAAQVPQGTGSIESSAKRAAQKVVNR